MTNAIPIRIADAVTATINAAVVDLGLPVDFVARRSYPDWDEEFTGLNEMVIDVVYAMNEDKPVGLDADSFIDLEPTINIVVRKRFETSDRDQATGRLRNESVDPLVTLLDTIRRYFIARRNTVPLDSEPSVNWSGDSQVKRWYDPSKLRRGLFEGYVQLKFSLSESI